MIRKQHNHVDLSYYIPYVICFFTLPAIELVGLRLDLRRECVEGKCDNVNVMDANDLPKSDPRNHRLQRTVQLNTVQYISLVVWLSLVQSGTSDNDSFLLLRRVFQVRLPRSFTQLDPKRIRVLS